MKRHPFLLGFLIVGVVIAVFYGLALLTYSTFSGGTPTSGLIGSKSIGVVEVLGVIYDSRKPVEDLIKFRENDDIKSIVLRVDSPGGGVGPSQEIYREVQRTMKEKAVIVSMGSVAASGGYYISCPADLIVANEGTITGSIGVIMEFLNMEGLFQWVGLKTRVIKSGKYKDIGNSQRKMTEEEEALLQEMIDDVHEQFVQAIATGREMEAESIRGIADGRIFSGRQAKELGLVDELGSFRDAVDRAAEMGGIEGKPRLVYSRKKKSSYFDLFFEEMFQALQRAFIESEQPGGLNYR